MDKVLILGGSGLVGRALINEFQGRYEVYGTYSTTPITGLSEDKQFQLEVQEVIKLKEVISSIKPSMVISCLRGEFDQQLNFHKELAKELRKSDGRLYFFSTTNVFDGDFSKPHIEIDEPIAESDYGKFKLNCENILRDILADSVIILRIPAIWGKNSPRLNMIKESIKNAKKIDVYNNLFCNNLLDVHLAKQLRYIIENNLKGIFHLGSLDSVTQSKFFEEVITKLGSGRELLKFIEYLDSSNTYYFALKSARDDMPEFLQSTNNDIISYLLG